MESCPSGFSLRTPNASEAEARQRLCHGIKYCVAAPWHAQAALDVFSKEPPPADNPLVGRPDVVCTPHLGASTREAQEGVALEIAEAVVAALRVRIPASLLRLTQDSAKLSRTSRALALAHAA